MTGTKFTEQDHARLATLFDGVQPALGELWPGKPYAGYKPTVREAPNGDTKLCPNCGGSGRVTGAYDPDHRCQPCNGTGRVPNVDAGRAGKRYLHVAQKYKPPAWAQDYCDRAFAQACRVATALGVPAAYRPHESDGTLRVLEYPSAGHVRDTKRRGMGAGIPTCEYCEQSFEPREVCPALAPGAGTAEHTDANLFTIVLWRSHPADLEMRGDRPHSNQVGGAYDLNPGLHIGEIGALVGLGPATPHRVPARPYVQKSIVYFAVPNHGARLPIIARGRRDPRIEVGGETVGAYLDEWKKRARVYT